LIITISIICLICLGYYISPLANVRSVRVEGADDLPAKEVVKTADIRASDRVIDYLLHWNDVDEDLANRYTEVKNVDIKVKHFNQLNLNIVEFKTIGYIKKEKGYCKILSNGKLGTQLISWNKIDQDKPVFIGYNHEVSLKNNLQLFNSLPEEFQDQIKLLSGNTRRKSQVIFVMKDGNVVIGNISTIKSKLKYYNEIKNKVKKNSLIDLEVGAYSRPLTSSEKRAYGLI
ncbi:cell division protein FtsQ/DivIB, partial [Lactobacillus apis]|uniref:cell division protein FtsQ/DivIB n=1 Tax=Lactobacillus apis TaxID=303541 RepID=UPI00242B7BC2